MKSETYWLKRQVRGFRRLWVRFLVRLSISDGLLRRYVARTALCTNKKLPIDAICPSAVL
jgi:hypothetical protein